MKVASRMTHTSRCLSRINLALSAAGGQFDVEDDFFARGCLGRRRVSVGRSREPLENFVGLLVGPVLFSLSGSHP